MLYMIHNFFKTPTKESIQMKSPLRAKNLLVQCHTSHSDTKLKDFEATEAIHVHVKYLKLIKAFCIIK